VVAEEILVKKAQGGDVTAYGELVRRYQDRAREYHTFQNPTIIADFDEDGNNEIYIGSGDGMKIWIVNNITSIDKALQSENFYLIADIDQLEADFDYSSVDIGGSKLGDADNDGRPNIYFSTRNPLDAIYDIEWIGGVGGDVTDPDNYIITKIYQDDDLGIKQGFVAIDISDLDEDGLDHQDIVFVTCDSNDGFKPGIFVLEHDATSSSIQPYLSMHIPKNFVLKQNYPNPFNEMTTIEYILPENAFIEICVYNQLGQKICTLVDEKQVAGRNTVQWVGKDDFGKLMDSGLYFCILKSRYFNDKRNMILLK